LDFVNDDPDNTTNWFLKCEDSTATQFFVYSDGSVQGRANSYGGISDGRQKTNVEGIRSYWDDFKNLEFHKFQWRKDVIKHGSDKAVKYLGLIAQEVEEIFPGCVTRNADTGELGVKYSVLSMINSITLQESQLRTEALEGWRVVVSSWKERAEDRIKVLEDEVAELKAAA
tara:strand:- start:466 stop:978 length:513 start_codon:yes stop_codon:yes gene_type:complete